MPTKSKPKKVKKLVLHDDATGIEIVDGRLLVKDEEDALSALERAAEVTEALDKLKVKAEPLQGELKSLRDALADFQISNDMKELKAEGWVSLLIDRTFTRWIYDDADIPANLDPDIEITPLKEILRRLFPNNKKRLAVLSRITKRQVVPSAIDEEVRAGTFTAEDVAPAFLQAIQTSYVQVKPE